VIRSLVPIALLLALALTSASGFCQVQVTVKLEQDEYLVGEPIFVIVEARNIGTDSLTYFESGGYSSLTVQEGQPKQIPNLMGCGSSGGGGRGEGGGFGGIPLLLPGKTVSFRHLLKGYRLQSGSYALRASGKAGVRWFLGQGRNASSIPGHAPSDPVEGDTFDVSLRLKVRDGTEDELKQRYIRFVEARLEFVGAGLSRHHAWQAMAEMAPPFLEKTLLEFAKQPGEALLAVDGLAQVPTPESRADLIHLYDTTPDLRLRGAIVEGLAGIATPEELPFLSSLLPGHSSDLDDWIRRYAALGMGRIGGKEAVEILKSGSGNPDLLVRGAVARALGNTRSASAVPILIDMAANDSTSNDVGWALITLTHRKWFDGGLVVENKPLWRKWWRSNGSRLPIYGPNECPELQALQPIIRRRVY
jgi:hypothetical protein